MKKIKKKKKEEVNKKNEKKIYINRKNEKQKSKTIGFNYYAGL